MLRSHAAERVFAASFLSKFFCQFDIIKLATLEHGSVRYIPVYIRCTANEGPVRIQFKCLVPIYVFPEMKLRGLVTSKTEL
jgi:hypothetical protein